MRDRAQAKGRELKPKRRACAAHVSGEPRARGLPFETWPLFSLSFHYAWGGRLCLHPFNLGIGPVASRRNQFPNLKSLSLSRCDKEGALKGDGESRRFPETGRIMNKSTSQSSVERNPNLEAESLLVIFPTSPKRVITPCRNATGGSDFKFGISLSCDSAMRNPKLNGSGH